MSDQRITHLEEDLPSILRAIREDAGLSQRELAIRMGTSQPTIARWESGRDEPRLSSMQRVAEACEKKLSLVISDAVDRSQIRAQLRLTPRERLASNASVVSLRSRVKRAS